eukprot:scaffold154442_cov41-Tisochrysis_lutea.AAC.2
MYTIPGEDGIKYAYAKTDGQLAVGDVVDAYAAYTPQMLVDVSPVLGEALGINEWYKRKVAIFNQELILTTEEVTVPINFIVDTVIAVDPSYLVYIDGGSIASSNVFVQMVCCPHSPPCPHSTTHLR